jgi:polyisoprenyl-phosphate glycosyltransferase
MPSGVDVIEFSLVVPVYRNEENIPDLIEAVGDLLTRRGTSAEVIFVVDGSPDRSHELLRATLPHQPWRSQLVTHSRNFGSFAAIRTGMTVANGKAIAVMAADLQEPPELVIQFWDILARDQADVVFGKRIARNDSFASRLSSSIFWAVYRKLVFPDIPDGGVDMFAVNARAKDAVLSISEPNSSLIGQLFWVGFRRKFVPYERSARRAGRSGWTIRRKMIYMVDSFIAFSDLPIIFQIWLGLLGVLVSGATGAVVVIARIAGWITLKGYTPVILMVAFVGSFLLLSQGILGLYLWRTFENTKRRPLSIVSEHLHFGTPE